MSDSNKVINYLMIATIVVILYIMTLINNEIDILIWNMSSKIVSLALIVLVVAFSMYIKKLL